ncbi:protein DETOXIFICATION 30 [Sesamum angolense]|uniref:Protein DETOXIFICATION 30 n=1 Tax=Sesamum angolense TaxID=2727404 RepID=A0AAE2BYS7_9LAMI|nr:protein DETOXIFICATION 30 [Sesamum angolense]
MSNFRAAGNGKCGGNVVRAGLRGGAARNAGRLFAEIMGYPSRDLMSANISLHFRITVPATDRADGEHIAGRREVSTMDDSSAFRLRPKFSDGQVLAGAEQNHGHGLDLRGGVGVAYSVQLAADAETWVGMVGGATMLDASWWFIVVAQLIYILSGTCGKAWTGFTLRAFQNLWGFVRLSVASAVMLCLETWYFMALVLFAGYLKDAEVSVAALSVCTNIMGWTNMIAIGFNAAISVRVSNELGAGHPRTAKFSVVVMVISAFLIGLFFSMLILIFQGQYPSLFTRSSAVKQVVYDLSPLLAFCIVVNSIQPALSGVAIGAGWQALIANVNIVCYYVFGVPLGLILGYKLDMGVRASMSAQRIRHWRAEIDVKRQSAEKLII